MFIAGVVNVGPENTGDPPLSLVYQLKTVPGVFEDAVNVVLSPGFTFRVGGVIVKSGVPLMVIVAGDNGDIALVPGLTAWA